MAAKVAPSKNTGGGGFVFENDVCASLLASMLVEDPVFGPDYGAPVQLEFQTAAQGWLLDDILVTTDTKATQHRFAISVKSNAQFTAKAAPPDFVEAAWKQFLHIGSEEFDADRDFMVLVTGRLSQAAHKSVAGLVSKAVADDVGKLADSIVAPGFVSKDQRSLFDSFACPAELERETTKEDTVRFLRRLQFRDWDFGEASLICERHALKLCQDALKSNSMDDAKALWATLRAMANDLRPKAGSITLHGLEKRLRGKFDLKAYPDHTEDWRKLDERSEREAGVVRDTIAQGIRLPRDETIDSITTALRSEKQVLLLGPSGVGKSALARAVFEGRRERKERTLWIDASSLDVADYGAFEATLRLRNSLSDVLRLETSSDPLLVIDGLDRLYSENAFRNVAMLLRELGPEQALSPWRVLAPCQTQEWSRVKGELRRATASDMIWSLLEIKTPDPNELQSVLDGHSSLSRLFQEPKVAMLLANLKLLDLVVGRLADGSDIDTAFWVGETSVAEWFWDSEINRGTNPLERCTVVRNLAERQADQLVTSIPEDAFDPGLLGGAQSLLEDQLLSRTHYDRLAFSHDLYGDWVRLRILRNQGSDIVTYLRDHHKFPPWHRAIRLFGIHILEREGRVDHWIKLMRLFEGSDMVGVRDTLLEAPAFAMNATALLESVFPFLFSGQGDLLCRLLSRFLAFATVPDERMLAVARAMGVDVNEATVTTRQPYGANWPDVLAALHAHREEVLRVAPSETAKLVELWLEWAALGSAMRKEAADFGVMLGRKALESRISFSEREDRKRYYRCALLAAAERPEDVAEIARTAANRVAKQGAADVDVADDPRPTLGLGLGVTRGPWPDGPLARVDDVFRDLVLDDGSIQKLYDVRASVAREVILATLIEGPYEASFFGSEPSDRNLDLASRFSWHDAHFLNGPFLICLGKDFGEGLEIVARLVDFATGRFGEYALQFRNEWRARAIASGRDEAEVDRTLPALPQTQIQLYTGKGRVSKFEGGSPVYLWNSGIGLGPVVVESALMALEQYFYSRLDANEDVTGSVERVLSRGRSSALLGVLCDVGKREPSLFDGPLRPLLSAPEIFSCELQKLARVSSGVWNRSILPGHFFVDQLRQFRSYEHRRKDFRYVAQTLLLNQPGSAEFFEGARAWWDQRRANGESLEEMTHELDLMLDRSRYGARLDPKRGWVWFNADLERMLEERAKAKTHQDTQLMANLLGFLSRCRTTLNEGKVLGTEEIENLWEHWQQFYTRWDEGIASRDVEGRAPEELLDAVMGGVAVFLSHAEWLDRYSERRVSLVRVVERIGGSLNSESEQSRMRHFSEETWECFLAEAASMLWARDRSDERWRNLVARLVFNDSDHVVRFLFARCAALRGTLRGDFERLRRLVIDWAHVRGRSRAVANGRQLMEGGETAKLRERLQRNVNIWRETAVASFVSGEIESVLGDWRVFLEAKRFEDVEVLCPRMPEYLLMDFSLVRTSHDWMPMPDECLDGEERARVIEFWRVALDSVAARPRADLRRRDGQFPMEDELWVLRNVAAVVLQLRPEEEPESLWKAILDLHSEASSWPENFLNLLHFRILDFDKVPESVGSLVREVVRYAFGTIDGNRRWPRHSNAWDALLGIDSWTVDAGKEHHADYVLSIWDVFELWMAEVTLDSRRVARFARWLQKPAAKQVRVATLPWFFGVLQAGSERPIHSDQESDDAVARLLKVVWSGDEARIRATTDLSEAFRGILAILVDRQNPLALGLHGHIGNIA